MTGQGQHSHPVFSVSHEPGSDYDYASGAVFLIDKPSGWTSFRVVGLLRKLIGVKKVGHAGTLDPMATGLLIVCTGKATKTIHTYQDARKQYIARVTFGYSTPSYDAETEPDQHAPWDHINKELIEKSLQENFTGPIQQIPPMYSAIKKDGQRLYKLARAGKSIEREPRSVHIDQISLSLLNLPDADLVVNCSKGTYIRSLAHDLGISLNSRACLTALRRTKIGDYHTDDALSVPDLIKLLDINGKTGITL